MTVFPSLFFNSCFCLVVLQCLSIGLPLQFFLLYIIFCLKCSFTINSYVMISWSFSAVERFNQYGMYMSWFSFIFLKHIIFHTVWLLKLSFFYVGFFVLIHDLFSLSIYPCIFLFFFGMKDEEKKWTVSPHCVLLSF